jgi:drug/metabolite transporter (DMT)-like permease
VLAIYFIFGGTMFLGIWIVRWLWNYAMTKIEARKQKLGQYGEETSEKDEA